MSKGRRAMSKKKKHPKSRNPVLMDLRTPKYRPRVEPSHKAYNRRKEKRIDE